MKTFSLRWIAFTLATLNNHCFFMYAFNSAIYIHIPYCRRRCRYCDFAIVPVGEQGTAPSSSCESNDTSRRQGFIKLDEGYKRALLTEISQAKRHLSTDGEPESINIQSIYFGGGTPSLAPLETLKSILDGIMSSTCSGRSNKNTFVIEKDAEITIEIDPGTFDLEKLSALKAMGFNRLSLGVQSFDDKILESIGRVHRFSDIIESLSTIRQVYGDDNVNYSLDLISGLPGLSKAKWIETLEIAVNLIPKPSHLSLYDLQIEEGTVFGKLYDDVDRDDDDDDENYTGIINKDNSKHANAMDESISNNIRGASPIQRTLSSPSPILPLPSPSDCAFMYKYASGYLLSKGYEHYEISSYALKNGNNSSQSKRSKHNQIYWKMEGQWYAFGLGATSSIRGKRFARPRTMVDYIRWANQQEKTYSKPDWLPSNFSDGDVTTAIPEEDMDDRLADIIMTRLRTSDGLDLDWISNNIKDGENIVKTILKGAELGLELGMVLHIQTEAANARNGFGTLKLVDPNGFVFSNSIISSIFVELGIID